MALTTALRTIASGRLHDSAPAAQRTFCQKQRLVIGSAIPDVILRALQHCSEGTLLIVCRHSRGIIISDQLSLGHPNERDRQGRMGDVLERYQFRNKLI
jgi:hypothetical protein